ncbi:MAG: metallophosphoesterase family protein [Gemmatimonadota bacterium]
MRYGIVSDSHDRIPPGLSAALAGVVEIFHAGDICTLDTLAAFEAIAPVTAVHGNCDGRALVERLPEARRVDREGVAIALLHGHQHRRGDVAALARRFAADPPAVVIFGHSHDPCDKLVRQTRYFNPGTAGGIGRAASVGILTITDGAFDLTHIIVGSRGNNTWTAGPA